MIKGVLSRLTSEVRSMHEAAYVLGAFALFSTLLALVRDRLLAHIFGASVTLDIYYAAFRLPDFIYILVASMASVFVLVPFLAQRDEEHRPAFVHTVFAVFGTLLIVSSVLAICFTPFIIQHTFPSLVMRGYSDSLILLTRILLVQPIILGFSNIVASVTQYHGRYFVYAIAPLLYNIGIIIGVLILVPYYGVYGVGMGVLIGAVMHLLIQLPSFVALGYAKDLTFERFSSMYSVVGSSIIRTVALSANHAAFFILVAFAGSMPEGSIAVFTLALNLQSAPLAIIGASYSTAAFPTLSRLHSDGKSREFVNQVVSASRHIIFWSLPIVALVVVLRAHIVRVVFGSGAFDWTDTRLTAAALALFVISLTAQSLIMLFVRGYYATGHMWKPFAVSVGTAILTVVFAYVFVTVHTTHEYLRAFFDVLTRTESAGGTTVLMLPLAYSLATLIGLMVFMILFARDFKDGTERYLRTFLESLVGAFSIGLGAYATLYVVEDIFFTQTLLGIFLQGATAGIVGLIVGIVVLMSIGNKEIRLVWEILHRRFWHTRVLVDAE